MLFLSSRKSTQPLCQQGAIYTLSGGPIKGMVHRNSISFPEYGRREKRKSGNIYAFVRTCHPFQEQMIKFNEYAESLSMRTDTQLELNLETLVHVQFILFSALSPCMMTLCIYLQRKWYLLVKCLSETLIYF